MGNITEIINQILPWVLVLLLLFFTILVISNVYGIIKAKKTDRSLRLSLNTLGKVTMGLLYGGYILLIILTIMTEVSIITDATIEASEKLNSALNATNALTVVTFLAAIEFQDIFLIGDKNIYIGSRMYEIRRMRKVSFPKKHNVMWVYGQKEYSFSTRFTDLQLLKSKIKKF